MPPFRIRQCQCRSPPSCFQTCTHFSLKKIQWARSFLHTGKKWQPQKKCRWILNVELPSKKHFFEKKCSVYCFNLCPEVKTINRTLQTTRAIRRFQEGLPFAKGLCSAFRLSRVVKIFKLDKLQKTWSWKNLKTLKIWRTWKRVRFFFRFANCTERIEKWVCNAVRNQEFSHLLF